MHIVIDIPKEEYEKIINNEDCGLHELTRAIANGIPLPKEHGRLIDENNLKNAFISWSMAVQGLFTNADIASIIYNSPTIIKAESEGDKYE